MDLHVLESDLHVFENLHSMQLTIEVVRCWFDMICEEGFFRLTQVSPMTKRWAPTSKPEATSTPAVQYHGATTYGIGYSRGRFVH